MGAGNTNNPSWHVTDIGDMNLVPPSKLQGGSSSLEMLWLFNSFGYSVRFEVLKTLNFPCLSSGLCHNVNLQADASVWRNTLNPSSAFNPRDGGSVFFRVVVTCLQVQMASQSRRPPSTRHSFPLRKPCCRYCVHRDPL